MRGKTLIIAEAGVNHNGSIDMALQLVDAAANAGADIVKFQTFRASKMIARTAPKAAYQREITDAAESQFDMVRRLELDERAHRKIKAHCEERDIEFLSTPFDAESLDLLVDTLDVSTVKIPSGELTNGPFLLDIARKGKPVILSTGMGTLGEIEEALSVLAFGFVEDGAPSRKAFAASYASTKGQAALRRFVTLLHCTTEYPAPFGEVNLKAMRTLERAFGLPVGYSDHTQGIAIPVAAVALGACVVEKHFTLDRTLPGPDHKASLEPEELAAMVESIRAVEEALGDGVKVPTASELPNRIVARKSLVAASSIRAGEPFSPENLAVKRPGCGVSPMCWWDVIGMTAKRDYGEEEVIDE